MATFTEQMFRAAKLDPQVYEEVEADTTAMGPAMAVVVLSSVCAGIGSLGAGPANLILGAVGALIGWFIWAYLTYIIGTKVLPEPQTKADLGELMRTIGFAASPGVIRIFGIIPGLMPLVFTVAGIWMLVAMVIAVRQALDYKSTGRAVAVCVIGWVIQFLMFAFIMGLAQSGA